MEKRVCNTCGSSRRKSSFACHYESHSEICHACKDFCIHRVKLAHSKGVTVHELFAAEADDARLRRYRALTKAGVVWEQVARRQHSTRKRATKRRRSSSSSTTSATSPSAAAKPPAAKRRRGGVASSGPTSTTCSTTSVPPRRRRRPRSTRSRRPARFLNGGEVETPPPPPAGTPVATGAVSDLVVGTADKAVASETTTTTNSFDTLHIMADDAASVASVSSAASDAISASSRSPVPDMMLEMGDVDTIVAPPLPSPGTWAAFGDFDQAVEALVSTHDMNAAANVDEFTSVMAQLDATTPPLFDADITLDERLLALDTNMLVDSLATCEWDCLPTLASPRCDTAPVQRPFHAPLTVCT